MIIIRRRRKYRQRRRRRRIRIRVRLRRNVQDDVSAISQRWNSKTPLDMLTYEI